MPGALTEAEFQALDGRWRPLSPTQVRDLFADAPFRWWIAGGWAAELAGAAPRTHDDVDVVVLRADLAAVHLREYHLWEAHSGALRPLLPGERMRPKREQLWVRRNANEPWIADLLLTPSAKGNWLCKRDHRIAVPLDGVGAVTDAGVHYLRPAVTLLMKAKHAREKDDADFASLLPRLSEEEQRWLDDGLAVIHPDHRWRASLA